MGTSSGPGGRHRRSPPASALGLLCDQLRERANSGRPLPAERTMAAEFGVTRHRLRQALAALRASGELGKPPIPRGLARSSAALVHRTNPIEVAELRVALEPVLARMAALRATPIDIARIMRTATTLSESHSAGADLEFHRAIAAATRNNLAADLYGLLRQIGRNARIHVKTVRERPAGRLPQRDAEHMQVARAIAARDPDEAERAMRAHMRMVQQQVIDQLALADRKDSGPAVLDDGART